MKNANTDHRSPASRRLSVASFALMAVLAAAQLAADCVDGVTPNCADPSVCAPSEGDAAIAVDAAPETSVPPTPTPDAGRDAEAGDAAEGG